MKRGFSTISGCILLMLMCLYSSARAEDSNTQSENPENQAEKSAIEDSNQALDSFLNKLQPLGKAASAKLGVNSMPHFKVAEFGSSRVLDIRGPKTFTPDEIKSALFHNLSVAFAETPSAEVSLYEEALKKAVLAGYRQAGFPEINVSVEMNWDQHGYQINIQEGDRYLNGNIQVRNAKTISAEKLTARLQSKHLPANAILRSFQNNNGETTEIWVDENGNNVKFLPAVWVPGKPTAFEGWTEMPANRYADPPPLKPAPSINEDIKAAFEEQGYFFANFKTQYVLNQEEKTASLVIDIADEGPLSEIGDIEIIGNKINSREEVLDYLGIKPKMSFTREDLLRLNKKLWDAARFIKARVTPMKPASADDKLLLRIELTEYLLAPKLSKPFSTEEQIMLKCGEWLGNNRKWNGDMVLQVESGVNKLEIVESPTDGSYLQVHGEYPQANEEKGVFDYALINSSEEMGIYSVPQERKYRADKSQCISGATFSLRFGDESDSKHLFYFSYGFYCNSPNDDDPPKSTFNIHLQIPPACCVAMVHYQDPIMCLSDGVLTITDYTGSNWKIDAATGRLLSMVCDSTVADYMAMQEKIDKETVPENILEDPLYFTPVAQEADENDENDPAEYGPEPSYNIELRFEKGAFKAAADKIHRDSKDFPNEYDPQRCFVSLLAFCCNDPSLANYLKEQKYNEKWLTIAYRLLVFGVLDPLDRMFNASLKDDNHKFWIPDQPGWPNLAWNIVNPTSWIRLGFLINDDLFPQSSWPWTVVQQYTLWSLEKGQYLDEELNRLYASSESGPLCFLVLGWGIQHSFPNSTGFALLAERGLRRLNKKDFLKDCEPFLSKDHQVGLCLRRLVDMYRFLSDEEVEVLADGLDEQSLKYFAVCDHILRRQPDKDFDKVMPELLGELWDAGLKEQIKQALIELRDGKK
jgi:hypothetical protein